jgi:hypothetical protein
MAVIRRRELRGQLALAGFLQPFRRAEAAVRVPSIDELTRVLPVEFKAFRLDVRTVRALSVRALVIVDSSPFESRDKVLDRAFDFASLVRVLDAEDKLAAVMSREEIVKEGGPQSADVQKAGRTRSEPHA